MIELLNRHLSQRRRRENPSIGRQNINLSVAFDGHLHHRLTGRRIAHIRSKACGACTNLRSHPIRVGLRARHHQHPDARLSKALGDP